MNHVTLSHETENNIAVCVEDIIQNSISGVKELSTGVTIHYTKGTHYVPVEVSTLHDCDGDYCPDTNTIRLSNYDLLNIPLDNYEKIKIVEYRLISTLQHECIHAIQNFMGLLDMQNYTINDRGTYWEHPLEIDTTFNDVRRDLEFKVSQIVDYVEIPTHELYRAYIYGDARLDGLDNNWKEITRMWLTPLSSVEYYREKCPLLWNRLLKYLGEYLGEPFTKHIHVI